MGIVEFILSQSIYPTKVANWLMGSLYNFRLYSETRYFAKRTQLLQRNELVK